MLVGPGDDAAVLEAPAGALVVSQDAVVEGVDFRRSWSTPAQVGWRALAAALSDLAGMGARARWCLATVCAPATTRLDDVIALQAGVVQAAGEAGCRLVGGDVSATDGPLVIDVCVIGEADAGALLRRDAGRPGDALLVTGWLGRAAAGLRLLEKAGVEAVDPPRAAAERWVGSQLRPHARVREGRALVAAGVRCGGDISDGLLADAERTAAASGCGAELWVDQLPVDPELRDAFPDDWLELVVGGGEDFELLAAAPADVADAAIAAWAEGMAPLRRAGRLVPTPGVRLLRGRGAEEVAAPRIGSRHFA